MKIKRAEKHVEDLKSIELNYTVTIVPDIPSGGTGIKYELPNAEASRTEIALITGDAIHNLHAALDYAWIGARRRIDPSINLNKAKFPIRDKEEQMEAILNGVSIGDLAQLVMDFKPWRDGDSTLWAIHKLDIEDKHKLLLPLIHDSGVRGIVLKDKVTGDISNDGFTFPFTPGEPRYLYVGPSHEVIDPGKFSGAVFLAPTFDGTLFRFRHTNIVDTLGLFSNAVTTVVHALETFRTGGP